MKTVFCFSNDKVGGLCFNIYQVKVNNCLSSQENMMQDLTAVRELCMKLDQTRESLSRQLAAKTLDHEQVRQQRYYNVSTILKPLNETRSAKRIFLQKTCGEKTLGHEQVT